jgi:hypothetical protein
VSQSLLPVTCLVCKIAEPVLDSRIWIYRFRSNKYTLSLVDETIIIIIES